ncbi:MAG: hypothetical protein WD231_05305 [Candidatus Woykebacteria bacterium]
MAGNNNYWAYWDFAFPIRLGNKNMLSKRIVVFLLLQYSTVFLYLIILFSFFESNINTTGGRGLFAPGKAPATTGDFLAFAGYLTIAWVFWYIYDKKYQRQ